MTQRQWYDYNIKQGNLPAFDYPDIDKRIDSKYLEFYNPKSYKRNPEGGFINASNPNLTLNDPNFGDPYIKYDTNVGLQNTLLEPPVQIAPGHKALEIGPNLTVNPNTSTYTDSKTKKQVEPIVEQYRSGGLVKKIRKGYVTGGVVERDYTKAGNIANTAADGLLMAGQLGSTMINNDSNEQGQVDTSKAGWQGALSGAGAGAKTGAAIGSVFGPIGTAVGAGAGALAAGIYGFSKGKNAAEDANRAAEEQRLAEEKERKRLLGEQSINSALSQRALENYADGGPVKGPGGPKDDLIKTSVPDGSFVVPAENAGLAKKLRKELLVPVKLSDGEHVFTPEERAKLEAMGIDLNKLAPNAKTKLREEFNSGGLVKRMGYAEGGPVGERERLAKEKARIEREAKEGAQKKLMAESKRKVNNYVYSQLERQMNDKASAKKDLDVLTKEYEALQQAYDKYSKDIDTELNRGESSGEKIIGIGKQSTAPVDVIRQKEDLLSKVEAAKAKVDKAQKAVEYANNESNYISPRKGLTADLDDKNLIDTSKSFTDSVREAAGVKTAATAEKPYMVDPRDVPSASELYKAEQPAGLGQTGRRTSAAPAPEVANANGLSSAAMRGLTPSIEGDAGEGLAPYVVPQPQQGDQITGGMDYNVDPAIVAGDGDATQAGGGQRKGYSVDANGILRNLFNYGVPILQTALGKKYLDKAGERPIDQFDPEYQKSIDAARKDLDLARANAKFGFTAEEQALLNQDNANALAQGRAAARNYSGGSAANAYNLEMGAINNSFTQGLQTKVQNKQLQLEKQGLARQSQQYLDNLVSGGTDIKRRLYQDADRRYLQNQEAGAGLIGAGMNNLVEASRYDAELDAYKKRLNQYGQ